MAASGWHKDARVIVVALHTLGVTAVALFIALQLPQDHHVSIAWGAFLVLDFPVSLLTFDIVPRLLRALSHPASYLYPYMKYAVIPAVVFVFLGGLQWYGIASVIRWAVRRKDRSRCRKCGYALRGLPELRCPECGTPLDAAWLKKLHGNGG